MGIIKKLKKLFFNTKGKRIVVSVIIGLLTCGLVGSSLYIYLSDQPDYSGNEGEVALKDKKYQEKDLAGLVSGMTDRYIVVNSSGIDYFYHIQCNGDIIKYVNVDSSTIDLATIGSYDITYTVGVDALKLAEHLQQTVSIADEDVVEVNVVKKIHVISDQEAQTLTEAGTVVYTNNNEIVVKSDGTANEEINEEIENPVSPSDLNDDDDDERTNNRNNNNQTNNNNRPTNNDNQTNENQNNNTQPEQTTPSTPSENNSGHQHNWQPVEESIGEWEITEVNICNGCGEKDGSHKEGCDGSAGYTLNTQRVWVSNGTAVTHYECECGATTSVPY